MFAFLIPLGVSLHYEPVGNLQLLWSTYPMLGFLWGDKGCLGNLVAVFLLIGKMLESFLTN